MPYTTAPPTPRISAVAYSEACERQLVATPQSQNDPHDLMPGHRLSASVDECRLDPPLLVVPVVPCANTTAGVVAASKVCPARLFQSIGPVVITLDHHLYARCVIDPVADLCYLRLILQRPVLPVFGLSPIYVDRLDVGVVAVDIGDKPLGDRLP